MGASGGVCGVWGWYAHPDWGRGRCCDGPRCAVLPQQGYTPVSRHNTHVTAQYICHSTPVTAHYTCHKASGPCNTRYRHRLHNMQQEVLHSTYAAQVCSKHTCCLTVLLQSTNMHMADTHMCMSQKAMQAILLMRINCCKRRMTACC